MASKRTLAVAQHEAAHVVVGVALGLRLHTATVQRTADSPGYWCEGYVWFPCPPGRRVEARAIMYAAGIAWEKAVRGSGAEDDEVLCRALVSGAHGVRTCVRAAGALLAGLGGVHARVTRALLERDLGPEDIAALARGERPSADDGA